MLVTFVIDRPGDGAGLSIACATVPFQLVIASVVNGLGRCSSGNRSCSTRGSTAR